MRNRLGCRILLGRYYPRILFGTYQPHNRKLTSTGSIEKSGLTPRQLVEQRIQVYPVHRRGRGTDRETLPRRRVKRQMDRDGGPVSLELTNEICKWLRTCWTDFFESTPAAFDGSPHLGQMCMRTSSLFNTPMNVQFTINPSSSQPALSHHVDNEPLRLVCSRFFLSPTGS